MRKLLDEYLDGMLSADERAAVERSAASDSQMAALLARMKRERALRAAAMAAFVPAAAEAAVAADRLMARLHAPAGYVGVWARRGVAVAAALAIVAGSFAVGRMTAVPAPAKSGDVAAKPEVVYRVIYFAESGDKEVREFASLDETNDFVNKLDAQRAEPQVAAVDLSSSGSF